VGPGAAAGVEVGARAVHGHTELYRVADRSLERDRRGTGDERENLAWFGPARVRVRNAYGPNGPGWDTACIRVRGVLDRDVVSRFESGACKLEQ
jgi:hypothetical protein